LHGGSGTQELGRFIVSDPWVCGGVPVFKGTRILIWDVIAQVVALGYSPDAMVEATGGAVTREAIEEARQLMLSAAGSSEADMLVTVSSEFYEGPDHFAKSRAAAHVADKVDRAWQKRLLEMEPPAKGVGRLLAIDPDVDPYQPVFRGTRILLRDAVEYLDRSSSPQAIARHWGGAISPETVAEALRTLRDLINVEVALERPDFDKFMEETDRVLNEIEGGTLERRMQQADPAALEAMRAWRSPRKKTS